MTNIIKDLLREREGARKNYDIAQESIAPLRYVYYDAISTVENEFIKQKLYIPIDKLPDYLQGKDIADIEVVYKDDSTEHLCHAYGIAYKTTKWDGKSCKYIPARRLVSWCDDSGYSFERDIDEQGIVGFFNLELEDNTQVTETYMDEIIKGIE